MIEATSETRLGCGTKSILTYPAAEIIKLFEIICNNVFNDSPPNGRPNLKKRGKLLEVTFKKCQTFFNVHKKYAKSQQALFHFTGNIRKLPSSFFYC